jgi:hypothetical protein
VIQMCLYTSASAIARAVVKRTDCILLFVFLYTRHSAYGRISLVIQFEVMALFKKSDVFFTNKYFLLSIAD